MLVRIFVCEKKQEAQLLLR